MSTGFHAYTHFSSSCRQIAVELLGFLTVPEAPLLLFPSFGIYILRFVVSPDGNHNL